MVSGRRAIIVAVDIGTRRGGTQFTHGTVTAWCEESDGTVTIDLSRVEFIDTMGLVTVVATAERARSAGLDVAFLPPSEISAANYAARMHLGECLDSIGVDARLPDVRENDLGSRLTELHRFTAGNADALAERVHAAVLDNSGDLADAKDFFLGVSEVMWNVIDHSTVESGWAAMQVMPSTGAPNITFAVADSGVGLRWSLSRNHQVDDDKSAVSLAFQAGVSGTTRKRGMGLHDLYERVNRRGGVLKVWSGDARGVSRTSRDVHVLPSNPPIDGTIIYAAFKPGNYKEV